jgi:hypothetical protein
MRPSFRTPPDRAVRAPLRAAAAVALVSGLLPALAPGGAGTARAEPGAQGTVGMASSDATASSPAAASATDGPPPAPSFRRVKVGSHVPGTRRITVQIDGEEQARILAANPAVPRPPDVPFDTGRGAMGLGEGAGEGPGKAPATALGWYWDLVSPARADASSGRLSLAEAALGRGPSAVPAPRLATLQRIADAHGRDILAATAGRGVSPALVLAVIAVESAGRPQAVSHAGAAGLMQLMPATAKRFGVTDRMDPRQNIRGGVAYLDWLLDHFGRDAVLALAGYNAGEGAVARHDGVPPFAETRDYVPKVLAAWRLARGLCLSPPQLISDGCVFRTGDRLAQGN